jgi:hypothetical protein
MRMATVVCVTDCEVYELPESKAKELYFQDPPFGYAVLQISRDVSMLSARVQPIEGSEPHVDHPPPSPKVKWLVPEALNMIDRARTNILNCEYELSAIRARMDNIANDALSRDEMKPWIKER